MSEIKLSGRNALLVQQRTLQRHTRSQKMGAVLFQIKDTYKN